MRLRPVRIGFLFALFLIAGAALSGCATIASDEPDSFDMLGDFPTSEASGRLRPYQIRASMIYGNLTFTSSRAVANSYFAINGVQAGSRLELERWFKTGRMNRKSLGVIVDLQFLYAGRFAQIPGPPVGYTSASMLFAWRMLGYGHTLPWTPEFTLLFGPALEIFPAMSVNAYFLGGYDYNLYHPAILGAKVGGRLRIPLFSRNIAIETTGYYIHPMSTLWESKGGALSRESTKSMGATALLDVRINQKLVLGAGAYLGWFKLNYTPAGASGPDETIFYTRALIASARFNL